MTVNTSISSPAGLKARVKELEEQLVAPE